MELETSILLLSNLFAEQDLAICLNRASVILLSAIIAYRGKYVIQKLYKNMTIFEFIEILMKNSETSTSTYLERRLFSLCLISLFHSTMEIEGVGNLDRIELFKTITYFLSIHQIKTEIPVLSDNSPNSIKLNSLLSKLALVKVIHNSEGKIYNPRSIEMEIEVDIEEIISSSEDSIDDDDVIFRSNRYVKSSNSGLYEVE